MADKLVVGNFGYQSDNIGGQTIKTRNIFTLYNKKYGKDNVSFFDVDSLYQDKKNVIKLFSKIKKCSEIVLIPGQKFLKVVFPILIFMNVFFRRKIKLFAVGGWLNDFMMQHRVLATFIKKVDFIFVESRDLQKKLMSNFKLDKVITFPNFRMVNSEFEIRNNGEVFNIAFMARVTEEKGTKILFKLINRINENKEEFNKKIYLNFYGPIDSNYREEFFEQIEKSENTFYKGLIQPDDVFNELNKNDIVILPTYHEGEGFPGTIIDSYIAAVPVIVSQWKNLPEYVDHGESGYVVDFKNKEAALYGYVKICVNDESLLMSLKKKAKLKSYQYSSEKAWEILQKY